MAVEEWILTAVGTALLTARWRCHISDRYVLNERYIARSLGVV